MKTKMTVVVDNIAYGKYKGEWGLSILFEYGNKNILIDCGGSNLFAQNMEQLDLDIKDVDYGILSHAHYDHANGIPYFLEHNSKAKFYMRDAVSDNCYGKELIFFTKYIGIPKGLLKKYEDRIVKVSGDYTLCDGVYLIPHKIDNLEKIGHREKMYTKVGKDYLYDNFAHEQSVVLETDKGLVIINSCSHGGAANIIREIQTTFPDKQIYGFIGGFHLYNKRNVEIKQLAKEIESTGISYICTGHCTMKRAYKILNEELGNKVEQLHVGFVKEF